MPTRHGGGRARRSLPAFSGLLLVAMLLWTAVLSGVASAAGVQSAPASGKPIAQHIVYTYGVEPANKTKPDGRAYYTYVTTPGAIFSDYLAVVNYSVVPLDLQIYATDALNTAQGGFSLLTGQQKPVDVGAWIKLGHLPADGLVTVPKRQAHGPGYVILPFTVRVPANASPGDHAGGFVASLVAYGKNAQGARVRIFQRVGSRIYIRVSGPLAPNLQILHLHATYHAAGNPVGAGSVTVRYVVRNSGNLKLGGVQTVTVSGVFGTKHAAKLATIPLLLPGSSVTETAVVKGVLPAFLLTAKVDIKPLIVNGDVDPGLKDYTASTTVWAVPWLLIIIILLLGAVGWLYLRRRRRSGGGAEAAVPVAPSTPVGGGSA